MKIPVPTELAEFPVVIELPVQWGDQDSFGHVNNTIYFRWFESARIAYLEEIGLDKDPRLTGELGPILAAIDCNFRRQVKYPDVIRVGTRVTRIGRSSMTVEHKLLSTHHQAVAADGQSTVVVFDYAANKPAPVPDALRAAIEKLEGKKL